MRQASLYGMYDRGILREGMTADLVLIRPERLPKEISGIPETTGIAKVFVGGTLAYDSVS